LAAAAEKEPQFMLQAKLCKCEPATSVQEIRDKRGSCRSRRLVCTALSSAALLVSSCIVVPHSKDIGQPVKISPAEIGAVTRDEVVARWGEPFEVLEKERTVAYLWTHEGWMICVASGPNPGASIGCPVIDKADHLMLIQFDDRNRVSRAEEIIKPAGKWADEVMKSWATQVP
jgi:hypothetical protein